MLVPLLFKTALTLHIVGFVMMAGVLLADYVAFRSFWVLVLEDWQKALWLRKITGSFPPLLRIGGLLILAGGITMISLVHVQGQLWFMIKMVLVVLIILNIVFVGARQGKRLDKLVASGTPIMLNADLLDIKKRLRFFHVSQLLMILVIFILSAFKFN